MNRAILTALLLAVLPTALLADDLMAALVASRRRSVEKWPSNQFDLSDDLADGVVAYYRLESTTYDEVSKTTGFYGGISTNTGFGTNGMYSAGTTDKHASTVNSSLLNGKNEATYAIWVKIANYTDFGGLFMSRNASQIPGLSQTTFGSVYMHSGQTGRDAIAEASVPTNQWVHIVGTRKTDDYVYLYIDGELAATSVGTPNAAISQSVVARIGYDDLSQARRTKGTFDEAIIWDRTLSETEIKQLYQKYSKP